DTQDPTLAIQLSTQLCTLETLAGLHARAEAHRARVVELSDRADPARLLPIFGADPLVFVAAFSSVGLWLSGQPDGACRLLTPGLTCAEALCRPNSLANVLVGGVLVRLFRGDLDQARRLVRRLVRVDQRR